VTTLNINKIAVSGWITLKSRISDLYTTKFSPKKKFKKKKFFCAEGAKNLKKLRFLGKKRKKRHFL
jgi:hypothetical protein